MRRFVSGSPYQPPLFESEEWRSQMQGVSAAIDEQFGEPFIIAPCIRRPNMPPEPSRANPPYPICGVFSDRAKEVSSHGGGTVVQSREPIVSFSHRALPVAICTGDVITRCATGEKYEVDTVEPDGVARVTAHLVLRGISSL